ncbi:uncharacterized protein LOC18432535 isoform X1 [Amborella trichopoda]|uniref:uncharacterized protein LOC18432535 isoform X1 n=1 Tax=Amborella trichopoda TaxID=13333 RepID=UPI0009C178C2|nr:uncharacterized protein LOC18432535 isoform X1 [Amborella trichopoda]XP_020521889.1 uncharacterized protein LOC18432535 isoform X1 [Amborella trichopoda]|eukprot:XP_020521888.1 uncharacterized protein LOC18432535 isoform X1 [Amborella trichopoda]
MFPENGCMETLIQNESISDDDEVDHYVVYNHNYFDQLKGIYQRNKKAPKATGDEINEGLKISQNGVHEPDFAERKTISSVEVHDSDASLVGGQVWRHEFINEKSEVLQMYQNKELIGSSDKHSIIDGARNLGTCSLGGHIQTHETLKENSGFDSEEDLNDPFEEETISDEENGMLSDYPLINGTSELQGHFKNCQNENQVDQYQSSQWDMIFKEAEQLAALHNRSSCSSSLANHPEVEKSRKGGRGKSRFKFSIRPQLYTKAVSWPSVPRDDRLCGLSEGLAELEDYGHTRTQQSIAKQLQYLHEKNDSPNWPSNTVSKGKGKKKLFTGKETLSSFAYRCIDNEDTCEPLDNVVSTDDEESNQNDSKFASVLVQERTMADCFQEAFNVSPEIVGGSVFPINKQKSFGYFGRLQQIIRNEKDKHLDFLKLSQAKTNSHDETRFADVRILSRCLEAKLTVCHCSFGNKAESCQGIKSSQNIEDVGESFGTVIFSSRICMDVEIEIGKLIRIHPPWKEVSIAENEKIVLCTYFSTVST